MENEKTTELKDVDSVLLAQEAVKVLLEKKAIDVKLFGVSEITSLTDYYVNATGRSSTQVSSLADDLAKMLGDRGRDPLRVEGRAGNAWILVDYGDVIVNIFDRPSREFYSFDRHLPAESEIDIAALVAEVDKKFELNNAKE